VAARCKQAVTGEKGEPGEGLRNGEGSGMNRLLGASIESNVPEVLSDHHSLLRLAVGLIAYRGIRDTES